MVNDIKKYKNSLDTIVGIRALNSIYKQIGDECHSSLEYKMNLAYDEKENLSIKPKIKEMYNNPILIKQYAQLMKRLCMNYFFSIMVREKNSQGNYFIDFNNQKVKDKLNGEFSKERLMWDWDAVLDGGVADHKTHLIFNELKKLMLSNANPVIASEDIARIKNDNYFAQITNAISHGDFEYDNDGNIKMTFVDKGQRYSLKLNDEFIMKMFSLLYTIVDHPLTTWDDSDIDDLLNGKEVNGYKLNGVQKMESILYDSYIRYYGDENILVINKKRAEEEFKLEQVLATRFEMNNLIYEFNYYAHYQKMFGDYFSDKYHMDQDVAKIGENYHYYDLENSIKTFTYTTFLKRMYFENEEFMSRFSLILEILNNLLLLSKLENKNLLYTQILNNNEHLNKIVQEKYSDKPINFIFDKIRNSFVHHRYFYGIDNLHIYDGKNKSEIVYQFPLSYENLSGISKDVFEVLSNEYKKLISQNEDQLHSKSV